MTRDIDYYRRRAIQEQVAAQKATCPTARAIHDELAAAYRFRVSMLSDAWAEAGVAIGSQHPSRQNSQQLPSSAEGSITAVASARTMRRGHPGAVCLEA